MPIFVARVPNPAVSNSPFHRQLRTCYKSTVHSFQGQRGKPTNLIEVLKVLFTTNSANHSPVIISVFARLSRDQQGGVAGDRVKITPSHVFLSH
jgi:hypothetical protein